MTGRRKAAIIGGGVIGGGWAARFLLNGWDVAVYDPGPAAARKVATVVQQAERALPALYDRALPAKGRLEFCETLQAAVEGADWVQESVPERLELKHSVFADVLRQAPQAAIVASSTSGFKPSDLNHTGDRVIVAHPFNPVYLLPLVELSGAAEICARAETLLQSVGMVTLTLRKEIDAHIADRLLEAVWREALWLIKDGICTTEELDDAIRMGFGLRWAQMGLFETYRIAGGEDGMRHFLAQFGPALQWPWTKLTDVPDYTEELVDLIAGQSDAQSGHMDIRALERLRDDNLVSIIRGLKRSGTGAGRVVSAHEASLQPQFQGDPPITAQICVPAGWTDYNGHMNETHYLEIASRGTDQFLDAIGAGADYAEQGASFFTVENKVSYLGEVHAGNWLSVHSAVSAVDGKKLWILHELQAGGAVVARVETLLLHVDMHSRKSAPPGPELAQKLAELAQNYAAKLA